MKSEVRDSDSALVAPIFVHTLEFSLPEISGGHKLSHNSHSEIRRYIQYSMVVAIDDFPSKVEST